MESEISFEDLKKIELSKVALEIYYNFCHDSTKIHFYRKNSLNNPFLHSSRMGQTHRSRVTPG